MIETKKLTVEIFNDQYSLISDENRDQIIQSAALVDELMKETAKQSNIGEAKKIAVLVALRIATKLVDLETHVARYKDTQEKLVALIEKEGLSSSF